MVDRKFHYGWLVVIACMFLNAIGTGIFSSIFGLFFPSIVAEYGYSQASVAGIISIAIVGGLFATGAFAKLYQKYSTRHLVLVFGVLNGISYLVMSMANTLPMMYAVGAFIGIFGMGATALSSPMLITKWFKDSRGTAMGMAVAGAGLGPAIMAPIITSVIEKGGHKLGFIVLGGIIIGSMIIAFLLIRNSPEDMNLKPYENNKTTNDKNDSEKEQYNYTLKEAFKTKMFVGFVLFIVVVCTVVQGLLVQVPSYLNATGFAAGQIGMIVAAYAFVASFGKILIGWTYDKIGVFKGNFIFFGLMITSFVALYMAQSMPNAVYLYVLCAGLGLGLTPVAVPLLVSLLFGSKHYSTLYPVFMIMMSFGAIVGGILAGGIIDSVGYSALIQAAIGGAVLAFATIQMTLKVAEKTHAEKLEKITSA